MYWPYHHRSAWCHMDPHGIVLPYDLMVCKGQLRCRDASSHPSSILGVARCLRLSQVSRKNRKHTGSMREIERFWETSRDHFHFPAALAALASICKILSTWSTWRNNKKHRDKLAKWIEIIAFVGIFFNWFVMYSQFTDAQISGCFGPRVVEILSCRLIVGSLYL